MILMPFDSVFLSEFHFAEKVQDEVGEFKSSQLVLLIINFVNEAVMVDESVQKSLSGMTKCNPVSYLTAPVNPIPHEFGELTYQNVLWNG